MEAIRGHAGLVGTPEFLRAIIDHTPYATMAFDANQNVLLWSAGAERLFGWTAEEVVGGHIPAGMVPADDVDSSQARIRRTLKGAEIDGDVVIRRAKDGRDVSVEIHAGPVRDSAGETVGYAGHMVDVTRILEMERDLALVGRVNATLAEASLRMRSDDTLAGAAEAICVELRRIPSVDVAALAMFLGDSAIVVAADAAPGIPIRAGDSLPSHRVEEIRNHLPMGPWAEAWRARPGDGAWDEAVTAAGVRAFAFGPILHGDHVDGGLAIGTRDPGFARTLVEKWSSLIDLSTLPSAVLADRLHAHRHSRDVREAIAQTLDHRAFRPVFQPIVELPSGLTVGHEALTRFRSGRRPDLVFSDAHSVGLGVDLELSTLNAAVREAKELPGGLWLDVNVSPRVFEYPNALAAVLDRADRPVVLEITEHEVVGNYDAIRETAGSLGQNVRLAVDDAGTGVANFSHIIDLGPDLIKLDRSLIHGVDEHLGRQALIVGMRYFSEASGCRLVAEGIETEAEARALERLGVELAQGYYFGRPTPAEATPAR